MTRVSTGFARLLFGACLVLSGRTPATPAAQPYTNRLIHSDDPYLLLHAHNPVDWYPWGPDAFAKAKAENKPIFLSIGYSTCYWCHVAEKEIYSNPAIAALMNKWFVNVKVDREERPDVDRLFIIATEMLTQHGAWPNNLFLTPDGKPFYAGSYFPPADDGPTPGFPKVLAAIHDLWVNHRAEEVEPAADGLMKALREVEAKEAGDAIAAVTPDAWLRTASTALLRSVDPVHGGFGSPQAGPKFPQAPALALLAADAAIDGDEAARAALGDTLDAMAFGGIRDQLAGGFHRYSTGPSWSVPHFEKMLSDNAQLLAIYADAFSLTKKPLDRAVALDTAHYLIAGMAMPGGGFATAQDAETTGVEGKTYLWTRAQIEEVLGDKQTDALLGIYELAPLPEPPRGAPDDFGSLGAPGVLRVRLPIAETLKRSGFADASAMLASLAPARAKLLQARDRRPQPARDEKIVTSLNGLAIGALARAGSVLDRPELVEAATAAATRIWTESYDEKSGALKHQIFNGKAAVNAYLDDYAAFADGLLDLAKATGKAEWRERAVALGDVVLKKFLRSDGTLATGNGKGTLLPIALGDNEDADAPSSTSNALALLLRLGAAQGGDRFETAASTVAAHLAPRLDKRPTSWPSALTALAEHPPKPEALADAVSGGATKRASPSALPGVPSTADHVHATATIGADGSSVTVSLRIDDGFHINAEKPTLAYLVPTAVSFAGATPSSIDYPTALRFKPSFAKDPLAVYEGTVRLVAHFGSNGLAGKQTVEASVHAQACDARTCLPPATLSVTAVREGG